MLEAFYSKIGLPLKLRNVSEEDLNSTLKKKLDVAYDQMMMDRVKIILITGNDMSTNVVFMTLLIGKLYRLNKKRYDYTVLHTPASIEDDYFVGDTHLCFGIDAIGYSKTGMANLHKLISNCVFEGKSMILEASSQEAFKKVIGDGLYNSLTNLGLLRVNIPAEDKKVEVI